eukprot:7330321-Pyramimonas_sp.AAC.1
MSELCRPKACNVINGKWMFVPAVDIAIFGFVCTDRSPLNKNRGKFQNSLQAQVGVTWQTFKYVLDFLQSAKPRL